MDTWKEWKEKKEAEFRDESGTPLPLNIRLMLSYHGKIESQTCGQCARLDREEGKPWNIRCMAEIRNGPGRPRQWNNDFPACGLFTKREDETNGDKTS
jgi:hypothetical protein